MGALVRGSKNAFRNTIRTISITIILALSIALALVMLLSLKAVNARIDQVKGEVGTTITVRTAGFRGFQGGGNPLTAADLKKITSTPHVANATPSVDDRLRTEGSTGGGGPGGGNATATTSLTSPIDAGQLGQRFGDGNPNGGQTGGQTGGTTPTFTLPITVTGTTDPLSTQVSQVNKVNIVSGTTIDGTSTDKVALVGKDLATKNALTVGSTFRAYGQDIKVAGIYDTGNTFTNAGVIMPLAALESLSGQTGATTIAVKVDSIANVDATTTALQSRLGSAADVVSDATTSATTLDSLDNVKTIAFYGLIGALVAGATIIFLTMLMIVRERRREIGVLKAIGASNAKISTQFMAEALTFTVMAAAAGLLIGIVLSNPILDVLVNSSTNTSSTAATFPGGGPGGRGSVVNGGGGNATRPPTAAPNGTPGRFQFGRGVGRGVTDFGGTLSNLSTTVGFDVVLFGILAVVFIALLGSAIPSFFIAKVRPAEVLRSE